MIPNINPETSIPFGYISTHSIRQEIVDEIFTYGENLSFKDALQELQEAIDCLPYQMVHDALKDAAAEALSDAWDADEEIYAFEIDGVKGQTSWLGGALLLVILESPVIANCAPCSPCCPNAGDLDNPGTYQAYGVPEDWRV